MFLFHYENVRSKSYYLCGLLTVSRFLFVSCLFFAFFSSSSFGRNSNEDIQSADSKAHIVCAHDVITHYKVPLAPLLLQKCAIDVGKSVLESFYEKQKKPWGILAFCLGSDYLFDSLCRQSRLSILEDSSSGSSEHKPSKKRSLLKYLMVPFEITLAAYGGNRIIEAFHFDQSRSWSIFTQAFSWLLWLKNVQEQFSFLRNRIDETQVRPHLVNTLFRVGTRFSPFVTRLARFFCLDRFLGGTDERALPPETSLTFDRFSSGVAFQLFSGLGFLLGGKAVDAFVDFQKKPWVAVTGNLLSWYGNQELKNVWEGIQGKENIGNKEIGTGPEIFKSLTIPLFIISGVNFAKKLSSLMRAQESITRIWTHGLGVMALWWSRSSVQKSSLEKKIVGLNMMELQPICPLLQTFFPSLPNLEMLLRDLQNLILSITYPKCV